MEKPTFQIRLLAVLFCTALLLFSCEQEEIMQEKVSQEQFFSTDENFSDLENALLINAEKVVPDSVENKWLSVYGKPDYKKREILYTEDDGLLLLPLCKMKSPTSLLVIVFQKEKIKCKIITYNELKNINELFVIFLKMYPEKFPNYQLKEKKQESIQTKGYFLIEYCWEVWTGTAGKMEYSYTMCRTKIISVMMDWNGYGEGGGGYSGAYDNGSYGGGGGGGGTTTTPNKPKSDLPKKKPKKVIINCNSEYTKMKEKMKADFDTFSGYKGYKSDSFNLPSFQEYMDAVNADHNHEYSMGFFKDNTDEKHYTDKISKGTENKSGVVLSENAIAHIHSHPDTTPPSPKDIFVTLEAIYKSDVYDAFYTVTKDGTLYAFKVTDRSAARRCWKKYKETMSIDSNNTFSKDTEFREVWKNAQFHFKKLGTNLAWEYTIAYLFEKYDMGITLLKKAPKSDTFKVQYLRKGSDGRYELVECK